MAETPTPPEREYRPHIIITNDMPDHPRVVVLGASAKWLIVELLTWCNRHKTDGKVPTEYLKTKPATAVRQLKEHDWLVPTDNKNEWELRNYLVHQWSRRDIEKHKQNARDGGRKGGAAGGTKAMHNRWHVKRGITSDDCVLCMAGNTG